METGYERIHLVGHSMGGLVARYYVQRMGGDAARAHGRHPGRAARRDPAARLVPHPVARQLRPDSDLVARAGRAGAGLPYPVRRVLVRPRRDGGAAQRRRASTTPTCARVNVLVEGVGHISLPIDGRVVREMCTALAHLDQDGTALPPDAPRRAAAR